MSGKQQEKSHLLNFTTAGIGGIIGWIVVHPFNTVSVRMNLASASGATELQSLGFSSFVSKIVKEQGVLSLYKGLSAGILRQVFYSTSRFGLFEVFRDEMAKYRPTDLFSRMITGVVAGGIAAVISCPAEVTLVRLSNDLSLPPEKRRNYKGVVNAFTRIISEEGPAAFFRGSGPFVNRAMMVGAVQVGTYDQFRVMFRDMGITDANLNVFCASMTSGFVYSFLTNPLETAKNRMAFQKKDPVTGVLPYTSTMQTISTIVKNEGVASLWKGFPPYYLRGGGHTVVMFMAVEYLREKLKPYF